MSEAPPVCMAPPVPGAGELQVRDSEGLVWPDKFPIRDDAMKLDPIGEAATTLGTMASRLVESTNQIARTWTGLQGHYISPEAPAVHALMVPAQTGAGAVSVRLNGAKKALDDYVTTLEGLRGRLRTVISDCESFRAEALAGVWVDASKTSKANVGDFVAEAVTFGHYDRKVHVAWTEDGKMVERNEALIEKYAAVVTDVMNAAITCANTIIALPGMPSELAGEPPMTGVSPEEVMALWGDPATEDRNCMQQTGDGFYDFGKGILDGGGMLLLGYDPETGELFSGKAYGQAWGGLGNLALSVGVMAVYGAAVIGTGGLITTVSFGEAGDQWMYDRAVVVRDTGASLIGYDPYAPDGDGWHNWKDEPWRVGTTTVANVVTSYIPGAGAVGGAAKGASAVSKVTRLAGMGTRGVADLALPGGSQAVRAVTLLGRGGQALLDGKGWSGMVDAMRVGAGRGRPNVATITAGTANAVSDLGKLTPPVHMSADVPSVSGSVRPLDGASPASVELPGAGRGPSVDGVPAHADTGSSGAGTHAGADSPAAAGLSEAAVREGMESWLYQDAPVEPSAAERAAGAPVAEPARELATASVGGERTGQASSVASRADGPGGTAPEAPRASTVTSEPARATSGSGHVPAGSGEVSAGRPGGSGADTSTGTGGHAGSVDTRGGSHGTSAGGNGPGGAEPSAGPRAAGGGDHRGVEPTSAKTEVTEPGRAPVAEHEPVSAAAERANHGAGAEGPAGEPGRGRPGSAGTDGPAGGSGAAEGGTSSPGGPGGPSPVRQWDPADPVAQTVPSSHPDAPRYDPTVDPDAVLADAPHRDGVPVDHRTGEPLQLERADGQRGWHMTWDQQGQRWLAENPGHGGAAEMPDVRATRGDSRWEIDSGEVPDDLASRATTHADNVAEANRAIADFDGAFDALNTARTEAGLPPMDRAAFRGDQLEATLTRAEKELAGHPGVYDSFQDAAYAAAERAEAVGERTSSGEGFGEAAGREVAGQQGYTAVSAHGAPGAGSLDQVWRNADGSELVVHECKSPRAGLGSRGDIPSENGPIRAEQGSRPYLEHLIRNDNKLLDAIRGDKTLMSRLENGEPVTVRYREVRTDVDGRVRVTDFEIGDLDLADFKDAIIP